MSSHSESAALVALLRFGRHPWQAYADLLEEAGSAAAVLRNAAVAHGNPPTLLDEPLADDRAVAHQAGDLDEVEAEVGMWEAEGLRIVTVLDPEYPENLLAVHDRPPFLFVAGRLLPADARSVAVIGSRHAGPQGLDLARTVASHLVAEGYAVVSGLAAGIDTAAHQTAFACGGRTIAVIGTGLRLSYPPQNAKLQRRIAAQGAVVSQFWPDTPPSRTTFPMRNAVMSGIALATVIVDAGARSGARTQARLALAHGRPVLLLAPLLEQEWARELATRPGTHVVDDAEGIAAVVERITSPSAPLLP